MTFRKNLLRPSSAHVLLVSFLLGMTSALFLGLNQALSVAQGNLRPALVVSVFLRSSPADSDGARFAQALRSRDAEILSAEFISKSQAIATVQQDPALAKTVLALKDNPLPATVLLRYSDRAWTERDEPALALRGEADVAEIRWDPQARSAFRSLHQWQSWVIRLTWISGGLLALWCFFGMYRFVADHSSLGELAAPLLVGLLGGGLALALWALAIHRLGPDALAYRPQEISLAPLVIGMACGLACFGLRTERDA